MAGCPSNRNGRDTLPHAKKAEAIAGDGTIYLSDTDKDRILAISPEGRMTTLVADPRLSWVDAMWIDDSGNLLIPAAQLNLGAGFNGGTNGMKLPITLYRAAIGAKPVRR